MTVDISPEGSEMRKTKAVPCHDDVMIMISTSGFGAITAPVNLQIQSSMYGAIIAPGNLQIQSSMYGAITASGNLQIQSSMYGAITAPANLQMQSSMHEAMTALKGYKIVSTNVCGTIPYLKSTSHHQLPACTGSLPKTHK